MRENINFFTRDDISKDSNPSLTLNEFFRLALVPLEHQMPLNSIATVMLNRQYSLLIHKLFLIQMR